MDPVIVDIDASPEYWRWRAGESMALTRARAGAGGFYVTSKCRRFTSEEMLKLQGVRPAQMIDEKGGYYGLTQRQLNLAIGNAMSSNVLERLLPRVCLASGLTPMHSDPWQGPKFVQNGGHL